MHQNPIPLLWHISVMFISITYVGNGTTYRSHSKCNHGCPECKCCRHAFLIVIGILFDYTKITSEQVVMEHSNDGVVLKQFFV